MTGFFNLSGDDKEVKPGKNMATLLKSKRNYSSLVAMFGGTHLLPCSIMRAKRASVDMGTDQHGTERSYKASSMLVRKGLDNKKLPKAVYDGYLLSGRGTKQGALSIFPQDVGRSIVLLYSEPGDTVFDPFAGHASRMELCVRAGRNYVGCDLSTDFMKFNKERAKELRGKYGMKIELHHVDSRHVPVGTESADMTITSPPYYDIEEYGDEPEQLGKAATYSEFLKELCKVMSENFRVLKPGKFAAWFINDFRKDGEFYFYHADVARLGKKCGFILHDILVVDLGRGLRECFANQTMETKILPKRHEYGVIFKKPD